MTSYSQVDELMGNPMHGCILCHNVQCLQTVKLQRIKNAYHRNALKTETVFNDFLPKFTMISCVHIQSGISSASPK